MATQTQALIAQRGGKRAKRMKNHAAPRDMTLTIKEEGQEYGVVEKVLGSGRFSVKCFDGKLRIAKVRGALTKGAKKKQNMVDQGDYVLVGTRDYQDDKCDIILKYEHTQVRNLIKRGELPEGATVVIRIGEDAEEDGGFDFENI